jgi:hypothetical protein
MFLSRWSITELFCQCYTVVVQTAVIVRTTVVVCTTVNIELANSM